MNDGDGRARERDGTCGENGPQYAVVIAPSALRAIEKIPAKADRRNVDRILCLLDTVPGIGRVYDPLYDAARPRENVMVAYAGHYGVYYEVHAETSTVAVLYVEDQRRDPRDRFSES